MGERVKASPRMVDPGHPDCNDDERLEGLDGCTSCREPWDRCRCPDGICAEHSVAQLPDGAS